MTAAGLSLHSVSGVCITHDHVDHILYAGAYGEKLGVPVYGTDLVHTGIANHPRTKIKIGASKRVIAKDAPFCIGPFELTAFEVPHDGCDNVGYRIRYQEKTLVIATDLGHISQEVAAQISQAHYLVLEANYDRQMLERGRYPVFLKQRIRHKYGHLSNDDAANFLASTALPNLSQLFLCHLSQENNLPELALNTVTAALAGRGWKVGVDIQVHCLPRGKPSESYFL
ncbi:MAG: MBL fold metallo-hydrolase [Bacteroidetes bacterium]|nr:MBL fold metallo-hydrolase [Bacteroidota bacterium]